MLQTCLNEKQLFREHANQDLEACFDMLIKAKLKPHRNIEGFLLKQELKNTEDLILILTSPSSNIIS